MASIDGKIFLTKNDCYRVGQKMAPKGIVVHSTGANNPYLKRYIAPDDGIIGKNEYGNDWNRGAVEVCVHAFIGRDKNGEVKTYQTLPFEICCWGCGGGVNGSYNYNPAYIQFEICEDDLSDRAYCEKCYDKAVQLCVYLCKKYGIKPECIVSHKEAGEKGYASGHIDPSNWWPKHGYSMDGFRSEVKKRLKDAPALDKTGYKKGDKSNGVLALKQLLILAEKKGIISVKLKNDRGFGKGTQKAVNQVLKKLGCKQNGIAGKKFIKKLGKML